MGNCFPKPVDSLPSTTKPWTPSAHCTDKKPSPSQTKSRSSTSPPKSPPRTTPLATEDGDVLPKVAPAAIGRIVTPNLKVYTFSELKSATRNFRLDTVLGEGGFGRVFKGWVDEKTLAPSKIAVGIPVAVKKSNPDSDQGLKEWQSEVNFLGKFSHPNLVKLLGYCWEEKQFLLVYEYMPKGSLESHLFRKGSEQLSWETRLKIAIGAARGLAFLHTTKKQVIYRDFKTANILLDGKFNAKLSDFGLAKLGPINGDSHVSTGVMGTYGYAAPEYLATGHLYVRSDVYGFGVVLLEILTGLRVVDTNRPAGAHNLVEWAVPSLADKRKLRKIMDPTLKNQYPLRGAFEVAALVLKCLESDPKIRPSINQVLETLEHISTVKMTPKEAKTNIAKESTEHRSTPNHNHNHNHNPSPLHPKQGRNAGARGDRR